MRGIFAKPLPPQVWEILAASLILAWRIRVYPWDTLWRDWVVLICGFWIFTDDTWPSAETRRSTRPNARPDENDSITAMSEIRCATPACV